jgi:Family of unknown function (DUF6226)
MIETALLEAVGVAFESTATGLCAWADPHRDRSPLDEEYSRVSDPQKWRIIGARVEAWIIALVDAGLATVERDAVVDWNDTPPTSISRIDRLVPLAAGALPIVVAQSRIDNVDDAGVTIGLADPTICVGWLPDCGCDACDSGSDNELHQLDDWIAGIVGGTFRRLSNDGRQITVFNSSSWSAVGDFKRTSVEKILANPSGWAEVAGAPWRRRP